LIRLCIQSSENERKHILVSRLLNTEIQAYLNIFKNLNMFEALSIHLKLDKVFNLNQWVFCSCSIRTSYSQVYPHNSQSQPYFMCDFFTVLPELHTRSWSVLQINFYNMLPIIETLQGKYWLLHPTWDFSHLWLNARYLENVMEKYFLIIPCDTGKQFHFNLSF
jgi:hypothetical protein